MSVPVASFTAALETSALVGSTYVVSPTMKIGLVTPRPADAHMGHDARMPTRPRKRRLKADASCMYMQDMLDRTGVVRFDRQASSCGQPFQDAQRGHSPHLCLLQDECIHAQGAARIIDIPWL